MDKKYDIYDRINRRRQEHEAALGSLCYNRYKIQKNRDEADQELKNIDHDIHLHELALDELEQTRKDVDTHVAIEKGALTLEQLNDAVIAGANVSDPKAGTEVKLPGKGENGNADNKGPAKQK